MNTVKMCAVALMLLCCASCSTMKGVMLPSPKLVSSINTTADLNPNDNGRASPLMITIVQLKNPKIFNTASFESLYNQPQKTLADSFVTLKTVQLVPDKTYKINWKIDKGTKYIGVIAAFNRLDQAKWKDVMKLDSDWGKNKFQITVNKDSVNLVRK